MSIEKTSCNSGQTVGRARRAFVGDKSITLSAWPKARRLVALPLLFCSVVLSVASRGAHFHATASIPQFRRLDKYGFYPFGCTYKKRASGHVSGGPYGQCSRASGVVPRHPLDHAFGHFGGFV